MTEQEITLNFKCLQDILTAVQAILEIMQKQEQSFDMNTKVSLTRHWKNANNSIPIEGKKFNNPSKTIPDQSLSIPEIMSRYARGLPLEGVRVPVYDGEEDVMPDISRMDLIDQAEYIEKAKSEITDIAHKYKQEQEDKKQRVYNEYKNKFEALDKKYKEDMQGKSHLPGTIKGDSSTAPL